MEDKNKVKETSQSNEDKNVNVLEENGSKKKKNFIEKFKELPKINRIIIVVSVVLILAILIFSGIGAYELLIKNGESDDKKISLANYSALVPIEQGEYYAKYEVDIKHNGAYELANGQVINITFNNIEGSTVLEYGKNITEKIYDSSNSHKSIIFYTYGKYFILEEFYKKNLDVIDENSKHIYLPSLSLITDLTEEEGIGYSSYIINDDGIIATFSRSGDNYYKHSIMDNNKEYINVCKDSSRFDAMDGNLIYSFDYVLGYDKNTDTFIYPKEMKNIVTVDEYRKNFDKKTCDNKKVYSIYKYESYDGKESYSISTDIYSSKFEVIDTYTCQNYDCGYAGAYEYDKDYSTKMQRYYIYDGDKIFSYDVKVQDGFKEITVLPETTVNIGEYNTKIDVYDLSDVKLYLGYNTVYDEHTISTNLDGFISLNLRFSNLWITLSDDSINNNVVGISDDSNKFYIYNYKDKKVIDTIEKNNTCGYIYYKDDYVLLDFYDFGEQVTYVYTKDFKLVLENKVNHSYTISKGKVIETLSDDSSDYYRIIDGDEVTYSSKFKEVLFLEKDYAVVINNNKLQVINVLTEEVLATFDKYNDDYDFLSTISGTWSKKEGKDGLYLIFGVPGVKCEDIDRNTLTNIYDDSSYEDALGACKDAYEENDSLGVEFYYIYDTKESGYSYIVPGWYNQ